MATYFSFRLFELWVLCPPVLADGMVFSLFLLLLFHYASDITSTDALGNFLAYSLNEEAPFLCQNLARSEWP